MKLRDYRFQTPTATICYARNGHRLHEGSVDKIPEHLLEYFITEEIVNNIRDNTYLEVVEDENYID